MRPHYVNFEVNMPNVSLDYKYYLTCVNWTNKYENVLCFATKSARDSYFDLVNVFNGITDTFNFNINNLYKTTIVVDAADYISALQKNYVIICKYDANNSANNVYYFYFITNAKQANNNRIELNIELDLYQQYYYDATFSDCPINRGKVSLNAVNAAKYYADPANPAAMNSEPIDYPLDYYGSVDAATGTNDINKYVFGWLYVFVDPSYTFAFTDISDHTQPDPATVPGYMTSPNKDGNGMGTNLGVLCFPIYNSSTQIKVIDNDGTYPLVDATTGLDALMAGNGGADAAHIYSIKLSRRPPFTPTMLGTSGFVSPDFTVTCTNAGEYLLDNNLAILAIKGVGSYNCLRFIYDTMESYLFTFNLPRSTYMFTSDNYYDPSTKLATSQYQKMYIDFGDGNKMEFDYLKAFDDALSGNPDTVKIEYREAIVPDITRYSVCIRSTWFNAGGNGIKYNNQTFTADMSMIFVLDQWSEFIANNKNFYAQGNFNAQMQFAKTSAGAIGQAASGNFLGAVSSIANVTADTFAFAKNRQYQVDNLKSSVDRVVNQNGSALFNLIVKGIMPSVVVYRVLSITCQNNIKKYFKYYGVNTKGLIGNIKSIQTNNYTSYHYAYIQADAEEITTCQMSLECENRFLQIFRDGVRFWYEPTKMYDYTY